MKYMYQVLISLKNNEKVFMNAICCSCDWRFKGKCIIKPNCSILWTITVIIFNVPIYRIFKVINCLPLD